MRQPVLRFVCLLAFAAMCSVTTDAQNRPTSPLFGTVEDASGAVVPGATVTVRNNATGAEFNAVTTRSGTFTVPALEAGTFTVTVTAPGFKKAVLNDVAIEAATPASVKVTLQVGTQTQTVEVTGGAPPLQTSTGSISTTIIGRQITELPFTSRDALDLVLLLPGTATPGRPRTSSVNGLPKGALNITLDGVNVQDNTLKSSDGFFTYIRPRIDAIDEVTVSTAAPGAESSSEGAIQIKFVTRAGTNGLHGSVYEYNRNPSLNANYWFSNRDLPPDPVTGKAPRQRVLLNQYGFRLGGPITIPGVFNGKERAFFFVNYEEYRLPEQVTRQRTILNPTTQAGVFQYATSSGVKTVDLLQLAQANGQTSAIDPTVGSLLGAIRSAATSAGGIQQLSDPNLQRLTFINKGGQSRFFPTIRFDFNLSSKHHLEDIYNYQKFDGVVDFLNGVDPAFPGFPNHGSQISNRFSNVIALRSNLTPTLVNEASFGFTGGTVLFFPEVSPGQFTNQGGFSLRLSDAGISNATVTRGPQRRNAPVWQFNDTATWTRGGHTPNFGFNFSQINFWGSAPVDGVVRDLRFGLATGDPAVGIFVPASFPGASQAQINQAAAIYSVLTGRVTSISGAAALDESSGNYQAYGNLVQRARMRETGVFFQDSWRYRPNLTLNYGLRWEVQYPFTALNRNFSQTTLAGLYGVSGLGNLFKPGTLTGSPTQFTQFKPGDQAYNTRYNNFAPSLGLAWSPNWKNGVLSRIFGSSGKSVIRGGYSIAYDREDMNVVLSILGSNPGGALSAARSIALGNLTPGTLLRNGLPGAPSIPSTPSFPLTATLADSANAFLPDLKIGYVQSWTFGVQREITPNTVIEARYVGNHGVNLWRQYNLNETNAIENGFLNEFKLAQANLLANIAAGRGTSFAFFGPGTGTSALPIMLGYFSGLPATAAGNAASYTSGNFKSSTFWPLLVPESPNVIGFANTLQFNPALFAANAASAGLPANFLIVNPGVGNSGTFLVDNGGATAYNAFVIELRHRFSHGLLLQGSYVFSKGLTNEFASSSVVFSQYSTLRNPGFNKTISPFDIRHGLKFNWIYELPVGRGKWLLPNAGGVLDHVVGGWEFHGTARVQSGTPFNFGSVQLVNMTQAQLQNMIKIRFDDANKIAYFLPQSVIDNTRKAFNTGIAAIGRAPALGFPDPNGQYIGPTNANNHITAFTGQNGFTNVVLRGLPFTRFDLAAVKKFKITERVNFELRAEFLDAFNYVNFIIGNPANDVNTIGGFSSQTFGQVTNAYQDLSTTNDPGGRLIQLVGRINF